MAFCSSSQFCKSNWSFVNVGSEPAPVTGVSTISSKEAVITSVSGSILKFNFFFALSILGAK